ncbi:hypothetical protein Q73_01790 [Bacillus coahuilensis m2-6]|nr:hypothetical protein Q73_01790 [Bacillus coahuilensis m2-6]
MKTENGYESLKRTYRCVECKGCPFQTTCAKGNEVKTIQVSIENQKQRKRVREKLASEDGQQTYRKRKIEVEPVFGQIKYNREFSRLTHRGLSKNITNWGLICVAHNLLKWETTKQKQQERIR